MATANKFRSSRRKEILGGDMEKKKKRKNSNKLRKVKCADENSERALVNQREEEIIEIDENGVVHPANALQKLKSTVLRDPQGEYGFSL